MSEQHSKLRSPIPDVIEPAYSDNVSVKERRKKEKEYNWRTRGERGSNESSNAPQRFNADALERATNGLPDDRASKVSNVHLLFERSG